MDPDLCDGKWLREVGNLSIHPNRDHDRWRLKTKESQMICNVRTCTVSQSLSSVQYMQCVQLARGGARILVLSLPTSCLFPFLALFHSCRFRLQAAPKGDTSQQSFPPVNHHGTGPKSLAWALSPLGNLARYPLAWKLGPGPEGTLPISQETLSPTYVPFCLSALRRSRDATLSNYLGLMRCENPTLWCGSCPASIMEP
jgi:hypothetical protein